MAVPSVKGEAVGSAFFLLLRSHTTRARGPPDALSFGGESAATSGGAEGTPIDETLPPVERVRRYADSTHVAHRLYVVRELAELSKQAGPEASCSDVVPAIERLVQDPEPSVRQALVEGIPPFGAWLARHVSVELYTTNVLHILLPLVAELTTDDSPPTRAAAVTALVDLAKAMRHEDLVPYLVPIIRSLAKDRTEEEHRVQAAILLHSLADTLGHDVVLEHVVPWMEVLAKDSQFRVRKAVAVHLGALVVSLDATADAAVIARLLTVFLALAQDEIWGVRKACCDNIAQVSSRVPSDTRSTQLVPLFERVAEDSSRWVRSAAFQALGPFIATFVDGRVDPKLLMFYRTMPHPSKHGRDSDIALYCAHSFPAVLLTVGGPRWAELSDLYMLLVKDLQWKVRRTLAFSLHEVARIVGPDVTERSLLGVFDSFLADLEEVKIGVVTHLADFFAVLSPERCSQYGHVVRELREDFGSWRFRELMAQQMTGFVRVFARSADMRDVVVPACLALARDPVLTVRSAIIDGLAHLVAVLRSTGQTELLEVVMHDLEELLQGTYHFRKTFAQVCGAFLKLPQTHEADRARLLAHLELLARDKTPNVRLVVAQMLPPDSPAREALRSDADWDVCYYASGGTLDPASRWRRHKKAPTEAPTQ